jgi:hypothetical protein
MSNRYRKKPVVIEAFQMTFGRRADHVEWPQWLHEAWNKPHDQEGAVFPKEFPDSDGKDQIVIQTKEGLMTVGWGDYIIQGVQGELYACKPDIFEMTYEKVE